MNEEKPGDARADFVLGRKRSMHRTFGGALACLAIGAAGLAQAATLTWNPAANATCLTGSAGGTWTASNSWCLSGAPTTWSDNNTANLGSGTNRTFAVNAAVTISSGGKLSPGLSPGVITMGQRQDRDLPGDVGQGHGGQRRRQHQHRRTDLQHRRLPNRGRRPGGHVAHHGHQRRQRQGDGEEQTDRFDRAGQARRRHPRPGLQRPRLHRPHRHRRRDVEARRVGLAAQDQRDHGGRRCDPGHRHIHPGVHCQSECQRDAGVRRRLSGPRGGPAHPGGRLGHGLHPCPQRCHADPDGAHQCQPDHQPGRRHAQPRAVHPRADEDLGAQSEHHRLRDVGHHAVVAPGVPPGGVAQRDPLDAWHRQVLCRRRR